jgi:hypothetical protein
LRKVNKGLTPDGVKQRAAEPTRKREEAKTLAEEEPRRETEQTPWRSNECVLCPNGQHVARFGDLDMRAQPVVPSAPKSDTPQQPFPGD